MKGWTQEQQRMAAAQIATRALGSLPERAEYLAEFWMNTPGWKSGNPGVVLMIDLQCELNEARELLQNATSLTLEDAARIEAWLERNA